MTARCRAISSSSVSQSRWVSGETKLNDELDDFKWVRPSDLRELKTTEGLDEIVAVAFERMEAAG